MRTSSCSNILSGITCSCEEMFPLPEEQKGRLFLPKPGLLQEVPTYRSQKMVLEASRKRTFISTQTCKKTRGYSRTTAAQTRAEMAASFRNDRSIRWEMFLLFNKRTKISYFGAPERWREQTSGQVSQSLSNMGRPEKKRLAAKKFYPFMLELSNGENRLRSVSAWN